MIQAAERMRSMRDRRRVGGMREVRLLVPDARSDAVRQRVAASVAALNRADKKEAIAWIEAVSEFDNEAADPPGADAAG